MKIVVCLIFVILLSLPSQQGSLIAADIEEIRGSTILNVGNNWVFSDHSENVILNTEITLDWTTNGSTTGWISCSTDNDIYSAINSTQIGQLSLIAGEESCSVVIYRVFKPINNKTVYIIDYSYSWDLSPSNKWLNSPFLEFLGILLIIPILAKFRKNNSTFN